MSSKQHWKLSVKIERKAEGRENSRKEPRWRFWLSLALAILGLAATLAVGCRFDPTEPGLERIPPGWLLVCYHDSG